MTAHGQSWTETGECLLSDACYGARDLSTDMQNEAIKIEPQVQKMAQDMAESNEWDLSHLSRNEVKAIVEGWESIPNFTKYYGTTDQVMSHFSIRPNSKPLKQDAE